MADGTKIEWSTATWNPLVGCTKVSPGCDNCYAEADVNRRHAAARSPKTPAAMLEAFPAPFDVVSVRPDRFMQIPLRWRRPRRIFVNSLSDLFHADVPAETIAAVFAVMAAAPQHTFQLLTKRHARMRALLGSEAFANLFDLALRELMMTGAITAKACSDAPGLPLPNVWLGVSVEDQRWADTRIPFLLQTPAAVRWISAEPLLGPIDLLRSLSKLTLGLRLDDCLRCCTPASVHGGLEHEWQPPLDWVVAGGESGPKARPMHPGWARALRDQCAEATADGGATAFLFKQWGNWIAVDGEPRPGDVWRTGEGVHQPSPWAPDTAGAEPGRWDEHGDALMRRVPKGEAGRELDGRLHDGYPRPLQEA